MENPVKSSIPRKFISDNNSESAKSQDNSPLVKRYIPEIGTITIYPHCVEYHYRPEPSEKTHKNRTPRSKISRFSKSARFRLFRCLAKIDPNLSFQPMFVTLTYHHGHHKKSGSTKSQLHHFLVMLRNYDPDVQFIWRFEFQKRGAPHYHLIIFPGNPPYDTDEKKYGIRISSIWHSIADPNSRAHAQYGCKVVNITSYKMACAYVSKYIGKTDNENSDMQNGKHWGNSQNLPFKVHCSMVILMKDTKVIIEKLRQWLISNGKNQYANPLYFNEYRDQTVFIDHNEAIDMLMPWRQEWEPL